MRQSLSPTCDQPLIISASLASFSPIPTKFNELCTREGTAQCQRWFNELSNEGQMSETAFTSAVRMVSDHFQDFEILDMFDVMGTLL